eukprot:12928409-Ditylum_brightwellii.AAC.1
MGDLVLFDSPSHDDAVDFAENDPFAYIDIMYPDMHAYGMKRKMERMDYPAQDYEIKWINWREM